MTHARRYAKPRPSLPKESAYRQMGIQWGFDSKPIYL